MDANLLVTFDPSRAGSAREESEAALKSVGADAKFLESESEGLLQISVKDPKSVVKKLAKLSEKEPDKFAHTHRYIPVEKWCKSGLKEMQKTVKSLVPGIKQEEKWKMNLNKRQYDADSRELIIKLTDPVDRPNVDLSNPDKIIQVEIVGKKAGVALLNKDELLEVKRK